MNGKKREFMLLLTIFVSLPVIFLMLNNSIVFGLPNNVSKNEFYPGDAVRITAIEIGRSSEREPLNLSGDYKINSLGNIILPLIGNVKVFEHDRISLAKHLVELYGPYLKEPYITTMPLIRVTLIGAFNKPGSYRISPESSLWELIEMAGGPRENCDLNSMRVERGGKVYLKNLLEQFERGYSLEDIGIKSGDQIFAKGKSNFGLREIMSYARFIMLAISLYINIRNYSN
ncbi:MAG: SLBB domain-containing protein [bacterium]|nr:MAG: SLBB domain-containing protein [bacterium]